jgi:uncharacterized protein YbjT (DUF2867 family)
MSVKAIIFGATGMVGEGVLHEALKDSSVQAVLVIGRRPCGVSHPKLREIIHADFYDYSSIEKDLRGYDSCFFCLGVTSIGKNEAEYTRLTYDLTMAAARVIARLNPSLTFCYVSGAGTDSSEQGRSMWARVKGRTENDLMKLPFKNVFAFRPGYIRPTPGLKNSIAVATWLAPFFPFLKRLFPNYVCTLEDIGKSMIRVVQREYSKTILECVDITRVAETPPG